MSLARMLSWFAGLAILMTGVVSAPAASSLTVHHYDPAGRLTTTLYDNKTCIVYAYDANGNRTSQRTAAEPSSPQFWGALTWGANDWTAGPMLPLWGSGVWGCLSWTHH